MVAVGFSLPPGVMVWQARCDDCGGQFGVLAAVPQDGPHPRFCPFCAKRLTFRLAYHEEHPVAEA